MLKADDINFIKQVQCDQHDKLSDRQTWCLILISVNIILQLIADGNSGIILLSLFKRLF